MPTNAHSPLPAANPANNSASHPAGWRSWPGHLLTLQWAPLWLLALWLLGRAGGQAWWDGADGLTRHVWLLLSAAVAVGAWWAALRQPPNRMEPRSPAWRAVLQGLWLAMVWGCVWLALPAWGMLKLTSLLAFAPALAWQCHRVGRQAEAAGIWLGYVLSGLLAAFVVLIHPWQAGTFLQAVWPTRLDVQGLHFEASQLMNTLAALPPWGPAAVQVPSVLTHGDYSAWWLQVGIAWGWVPMGLCAVGTVLVWVLVLGWLQRNPTDNPLALRMRRMGMLLACFHALAAGLYAAWSMGWLYRPMGALPPLAHAGWWMLTFALTVCVRGVWLHRRQGAPDQQPHVWRKDGWWAVLLLGVTVAGALGVQGLPDRVQAWADKRELSHTNAKYTPPPRPQLLDRTGRHVLATQTEAHDIWVRPTDFWSASWQNPKPAAEVDAHLNNAQRRTALLDALTPWPQAARMVASKLGSWPHNDEAPKLLLWAQPPEVVQAVRSVMKQHALKGLTFTARPLRVYPQGALTAHAVGFTSLATPVWGQSGLEQALDHVDSLWLSGAPRHQKAMALHTSLDMDIQRMAHGALGQAMRLHHSPRGAVVVASAHTGEVLAMVSAPSFDPNDGSTFRSPHRPERIRNLATNVPLTAGPPLLAPLLLAHAAQLGTLPVDAWQRDTPGEAKARAQTLTTRHHKQPSPASVLQHTGLSRLSAMVGILNTGLIDTGWFTWVDDPDDFLYEGGNTTLTGLVQAYLPIANGGTDLTLTLLSAQHTWPDGMTRDAPKQVLTQHIACEVRQWMQNTQPTPASPGLRSLDTVGTADVNTLQRTFSPLAKRPRLQRTHATYIGMVPAHQPRYVVGVVLGYEQPVRPAHGMAAESVFATLAQGLLARSQTPHGASTACPAIGWPVPGVGIAKEDN